MNKHIVILILGWFLPIMAFSQTNIAVDPEIGGRVSVVADWRIVRGLHLSLEEEARFDNNFGSFDRLQTTVFLDYKVHPNIKLGLGYALINGYGATTKSFKNPRHRFMVDVMGIVHLGNWTVSLKERLQLTHRSGEFNVYQNPRNALMLKSRLKAQYKTHSKWQPYGYIEIRNYMNAPVIAAAYDGIEYVTLDDYSDEGEPGWFLKGFNGSYINRLRLGLGTDIKLDRHNTLSVYLLGDSVTDKKVDANAEGTKLKSYTKETGLRCWVGAGYEFAF